MSDQAEIDWHREQIARNRELIEELEASGTAGSDVFLETQAEIDRLKAQIEQSELTVAAYEKEHPNHRMVHRVLLCFSRSKFGLPYGE